MIPQRDTDFYSWAKHNAELLRSGRVAEADWAQIAEELDEMSGSRESELENRLGVLLAHLLKWVYQSSHRGNSWINTIKEQRRRARRVLKRNPGLKSCLAEVFENAYGDARLMASRETGLNEKTFPNAPPFTIEQTLDEDFWPE
jgi:hypothetical protein